MDTMTPWLIGLGVTVAVSAFIRFCPKQKLMDKTGPVAYNAGKIISSFGNTKIGKVAMDKVEEGIIATILSVAMNFIVEFGRGLNEDK